MFATRTCWSCRRNGGRLRRFLDVRTSPHAVVRVSSSPRVGWRPLLEGSGLLVWPRLLLLRSVVAVESLGRLEILLLKLLIGSRLLVDLCGPLFLGPTTLWFVAEFSIQVEGFFARGVRSCIFGRRERDLRLASIC